MRCERVHDRDGLAAMAFVATVDTRDFAGQQLVYRVGLVDSKGKAIKSGNGRFQDTRGNVAATRTLMAPEARWTFENVRVTIPAAELEVGPGDLPVWAHFGVYQPNGRRLSSQFARLPLRIPADFADRGALAVAGRPASSEDAGRAEGPTATTAQERPSGQPGGGGGSSGKTMAEAGVPEGRARASEAVADRPTGALARSARRALDLVGTLGRAESDGQDHEAEKGAAPTDGWGGQAAGGQRRMDGGPRTAAVGERSGPQAGSTGVKPGPAAGRTLVAGRDKPQEAAEDRPGPAAGDTNGVLPREQRTSTSAQTAASERGSAVQPRVARIYRVRPGDTLRSIALRHYGDANQWDAILRANPGIDPRRLRIGQRMILPPLRERAPEGAQSAEPSTTSPTSDNPLPAEPPRTYVVRKGDTLMGIADRLLGDWKRWREILELNRDRLAQAERLRIGMVLKVPPREPGSGPTKPEGRPLPELPE
ncbi:MAG TPA: LysM peptidoglycan-binding domain-containing protein [Phycisphaerae bacterium]|nr:LysM peptidoglycan-binding domain-containing protein [Phycisphaerae bacterium]